jgi:tetratricopeptide (TPR) repeat protein
LILFVCASFLVLAGCAPEKTSVAADFWVPKDPPGAEYVIEAKISAEGEAAAVDATGTITLVNTAGRPISILAVEWTITPAQTLELSLAGRPLRLLNEARNLPLSTPLLYELPEPLQPGKKARLDARFTHSSAVREGQIRMQSWHPLLWWERIPVRNSFKVRLDIPQGYAMAVSGRLNPKSGYYENDGVTSRFGLYFFSRMKSEQRESEGVQITAIFTEKGKGCALFCLNSAADIIPFYKKWLGAYPHRSLYIIPGGPEPWGGYPFASGIVVIHGQETFDAKKPEAEQTWWKWITAHEIGHQYWGEYIMSDDVLDHYTESWLMIGMGICADKEYMLNRGLGWERYRGFIERYLHGVRARNDTTMDAPPSLLRTQKFDRNNILIHGKGFSVLSALETVMGREAFDRVYRKIVAAYAGKRLGWRDLRRACEEETGENLGQFFEDWVRSNKVLECRNVSQASTPQKDGYIHEVRVEYGLDSIRMPVPVKAVFDNGESEIRWTDRLARVNVLRFRSAAALKEVQLDPEGRLALVKEALPKTAEELAEAVLELDWTGAGEAALEIYKRPETAEIKNARVWFKLGMLLYDGRFYAESFSAFGRSGELDRSDFNLFVALTWQGQLKDLLGEREKAIAYYQEALKHDTGQTMRHDQYGLQINKAWLEERLKTPFQGQR